MMNFVAQMSVERLLNGLGEGVVIALFAWLLLRLIGRRNAGTRFAVWFCTLVAISVVPFVVASSAGATAIVHRAAAITMPREWSLYLFGAWAVIALVGLARVVAGLWHLRVIRMSCAPVEGLPLDATVARALKESRRGIEICASDTLRVPTAVGFFKPAVVLPAWALRELSPGELNAVVLHEVAHLRRWDDWTNLAQKILRALFFFHPAVWWVENRLSLEREMACDDVVLAQTANPRAYAECLVVLAEKNLLQRGMALAQAAVGRMRQTSLRVLEILDARRTNAAGIWKPAPWVVAGFSVVCLISAAHAPRLVAFGDPSTASPVSFPASANLRDEASSYTPPVVPASYTAHESGFANRGINHETKNRALRHGIRSAAAAKQASLKTQAGSSFQQSVPAVHQAKNSAAQKTASVQLVRTSFTESAPQLVMQQTVFVIAFTTASQGRREQEINSSGFSAPLCLCGDESVSVVWRVSIWRFAVLPQTQSLRVAAPSKSI